MKRKINYVGYAIVDDASRPSHNKLGTDIQSAETEQESGGSQCYEPMLIKRQSIDDRPL